jgi:hypothetical protein
MRIILRFSEYDILCSFDQNEVPVISSHQCLFGIQSKGIGGRSLTGKYDPFCVDSARATIHFTKQSLRFSEQEIDYPAAEYVLITTAAVGEDTGLGAAGLLQSVGKNR